MHGEKVSMIFLASDQLRQTTGKSAGTEVDVAVQDPDRRRKTRGLTTPRMRGGNVGPVTGQNLDPEKKTRGLENI